jgi:NAD(P)-dependent dehydrogenase (short-subunit alcohol dehydrogenase family)
MRSVLITGTSSGIGEATALRLDRAGMRVFAGVRELADGQALAAKASDRLVPVQCDITDESSVAAAAQQVRDAVGGDGLWGLVNNAGTGYPGPMELISIEDLRAQLEVNLVGHVRVTQALLPQLRAARGRLVFVGSIGGRIAFPFAGPYHMTKFAMEALADVWRQELHPDSIEVSLIEPGVMSTAIWGKAGGRVDSLLSSSDPAVDRYRERLRAFRSNLESGDDHGSSPDDVAKSIEKAVTSSRPASRYPVGLSARVVSQVAPVLPGRLLDLLNRRSGT